MVPSIIIAVTISIVGIGATVWLTNRHTTNCLERMNKLSEERNLVYFDRMESGFLKHFTALFYAQDKTSKEGKSRTITTEDFKEGIDFAEKVSKYADSNFLFF